MRRALPALRTALAATAVAGLVAAALDAGGAGEEAAPRPRPGATARASATFAMYCYWTGEATLGRVPGVLRTRIGHLAGHEVVRVDYDPGATDLGHLVAALRRRSSFDALLAAGEADAERARRAIPGARVEVVTAEPRFLPSKHDLRVSHPELFYLDLSEAQALALNSWSHDGGRRPQVLDGAQEARRAALEARLARGGRPPFEPPEERGGPALDAYRERLIAWLGT